MSNLLGLISMGMETSSDTDAVLTKFINLLDACIDDSDDLENVAEMLQDVIDTFDGEIADAYEEGQEEGKSEGYDEGYEDGKDEAPDYEEELDGANQEIEDLQDRITELEEDLDTVTVELEEAENRIEELEEELAEYV